MSNNKEANVIGVKNAQWWRQQWSLIRERAGGRVYWALQAKITGIITVSEMEICQSN